MATESDQALPGPRWTTFYDAPRRRVLLFAASNTSWAPLELDPAQSSEHVRVLVSWQSREVLVVEVDLDESGLPIEWPEHLSLNALGSMTVWPHPAGVYAWGIPADDKPAATSIGKPGPWSGGWGRGPYFDQIAPPPQPEPQPTWVTDDRDGVRHEVSHDDDPGVTEDELLFSAEGGSAYACRRASDWLVVTEEFALDDYGAGRLVRRFPTEQARDDFLRGRDWPLPANLACERARPDVAKVINIQAVLLRIDGAYATGMDDVDVYAAPGPDANSSYSVRSEAMTVADALEGVVKGLVAEPLFHLSLGSRELFHSNLLSWLCQQFPEAGSYVFRDLLEPDPAQRTFAVRREVRQLDLVIELPGFRPLVIENKVFSLPDESQLDRYARDNIVQEFGDRPVTRGLLSLVDPGWVDGTYGAPGAVWRRFSYRDLAQGIIEVMAEVGRIEPYAGQTLAHYASLLEHLTEFVELVIPRDDDEALALPKEWTSLLKWARLHDTAQKVRGRFLVHMLSDAQSMLGFRRSTFSDGFAHGQSILECFTTLDDGDQIGWQLQGDQFRISGRFYSRKGRGPGAKAERAAYAEQVHASWFQPDPALLGGRQLRPAESFNHFDPAFIYRYVRCVNLTVGELRVLAIAVTSTAELHAREQARQDSVLGGAEDELADGWWSAFEDDLTARLRMAGHDDIVGVHAGPYYAQVMGVDGEFLHCELVANEFLSTEWHLDSSQEQALQDRGWALAVPSAGPNWSQEVPRADARSVAAEILSALREVYRVDVKHLQPHGPAEGL